MEKAGYVIIGALAILWLGAMLWGMIAILPYGLVGLVLILAGGLFLMQALKDRLASKEDDYYDKNVDK